jgi:glycosyltransferase involved in cell wall biosynthesis
MNHLPLVSIIIVDYKKKNPYLIECLNAIGKQTYKKFEIILVCDYRVSLDYPKLRQKYFGHYVGPAEKRDIGAKMAKGEILAFIDDDAYPSPNWLKSLVPHFKKSNIAGVGGPGMTPPGVSWQEEASGWASASPVGAGMYRYRFLPDKKQYVDDYPSMNLAIRKIDFEKVGGYDSKYWPGEDTKLCLDLTHKLGKKIIYDPKVIVYHHRRPILVPHLRQNGNFGIHRGFFARKLPETSLKPIYFLPSIMFVGLIFMLFITIFQLQNRLIINVWNVGVILSYLYLLVLFLNAFWILKRSNLFQAILSIPVIFITHLWYGARFLQGFLFTGKLIQ